ncbi:MAG: ABC transporter ATP-binding protein [Candidatus Krumholzibacteriia bacterium]
MMTILEMQNVRHGYGERTILQDINLKVVKGEVLGLLGRNGAGKTTLIRLVMGMLTPRSGRISVFGSDPRRDPVAVKRRIGYVAEDQELPAGFRINEVVEMHRRLFPRWDDGRATELAARFELPGDRLIKELSKGQARQVALLCAVCHRPELLILDEPAGGLDPAARREFLETSIQLLVDEEATILFSSHHMGDIERMASRLVMIHEGQKWIDSRVDDIKEGYCLAQVPLTAVAEAEKLLGVPACLCVRKRGEAWHAVYEMNPEACRTSLAGRLGIADARCRTLNLEEMFIELAGRSA